MPRLEGSQADEELPGWALAEIPPKAGALVIFGFIAFGALVVTAGSFLPVPITFCVGAALLVALVWFFRWLVVRTALPERPVVPGPAPTVEEGRAGSVARPSATSGAMETAPRVAKHPVSGSLHLDKSQESHYRIPGPVLFFAFLLNFVVIAPIVGMLLKTALPEASTTFLFVVVVLVGALPFDVWFAISPRTKPRQSGPSGRRNRRPRRQLTRRQRNEGVFIGLVWAGGAIAGGIYLLEFDVTDAMGAGVASTVIFFGTFLAAAIIRQLRVPVIDKPSAAGRPHHLPAPPTGQHTTPDPPKRRG